jgi:hypothetical protein
MRRKKENVTIIGMGIDDISVSIGRLQATLEAHVHHSNSFREKTEADLHNITERVASIPDLKTNLENVEKRTRNLEDVRNQQIGGKAILVGFSGFIGAGITKVLEVISK